MADLTPRDPEWIAEAPMRIEHSIDLPITPAEAWAEITSNDGFVEWFPGCRKCEYTSTEPHGQGSIRVVHQDLFKVTERITLWEPNEAWGMTVLSMNLPLVASMAEDIRLTSHDQGTTLTWRIGVELTRLAQPLRRPLVAKQSAALKTGLDNLRSRVLTPAG